LGYLALIKGEYETAVTYFEEVRPFTQKHGLDGMRVNLLINLGHVALMQANYAEATRHYRESLSLTPTQSEKSEALLGLTAVIVGLGAMKTAVALLPLPDEMLLYGSFEEKLYERTIASLHTALSEADWEAASEQQKTIALDEKISAALLWLENYPLSTPGRSK
jgi:tetratricopeptide (TPR) repeat protein